MHVEITNQVLVHDIIDSYNMKELYRVFNIMVNLLIDSFQARAKELFMKKQSVAMDRRLTGHYLLG